MAITLESLVITLDDMKYIIDSLILQEFYTMYKGFNANDMVGIRNRKNRLTKDFISILKAFFTPSYVLTYIPNDPEATTMLRDAAMVPDNVKFDRNTSYEKALNETLFQIFKFRSVDRESFDFVISAHGYSRKLDILTKYFEIPRVKIIEGLYTICYVNNEQETALQEKGQSVEESSI